MRVDQPLDCSSFVPSDSPCTPLDEPAPQTAWMAASPLGTSPPFDRVQVASVQRPGGAGMSEQQRTPQWLSRWREKRRRRPPRNVGDRLFGSVDSDSEEKIAQRHTTRGEELAAEDRRHDIQGGAGGGLM